MEDIKSIALAVIGGLLSLITLIGGWTFKSIHARLDALEANQAILDKKIEMAILELQAKVEINSERDYAFQDKVMTAISGLVADIKEIKEDIKELYQNNKKDAKI